MAETQTQPEAQPEQSLNFDLTVSEANLVLNALGQGSYVQVAGLIEKLKQQAQPQLPVPVPAPAPVETPKE